MACSFREDVFVGKKAVWCVVDVYNYSTAPSAVALYIILPHLSPLRKLHFSSFSVSRYTRHSSYSTKAQTLHYRLRQLRHSAANKPELDIINHQALTDKVLGTICSHTSHFYQLQPIINFSKYSVLVRAVAGRQDSSSIPSGGFSPFLRPTFTWFPSFWLSLLLGLITTSLYHHVRHLLVIQAQSFSQTHILSTGWTLS